MKYTAHATTPDGRLRPVETEAPDFKTAMRQMLSGFPRGSTVSIPRPVDQVELVRDQLERRCSSFPLIGSAT